MNSIFTAFSNAGCTTEVFSPAQPLRSLLTHRKASLISWTWFINLLSACCSARKMSSAEAAPGAGMCRRVQTSWVPERGRWTGRRARTQAPSGFQACMALMVFAFLSPPQVQILVPLLKLYSRLSDHKLSEKKKKWPVRLKIALAASLYYHRSGTSPVNTHRVSRDIFQQSQSNQILL